MRKRIGGFTLIEVMVVVVVISLLAAVALPSYLDHVRKGRRSDAKSALMATAQAMERYYTENANYNSAVLGTAAGNIAPTTSPEGYYTIAFDSAPTSGTVCGATVTTNANAGTFRVCATPTGAQTNDSCGIMSYSATGVKTAGADRCW